MAQRDRCSLAVWQRSIPEHGDRSPRHVNERDAHKFPEEKVGLSAYTCKPSSVTQVCVCEERAGGLCLDALISAGVLLNLRAWVLDTPGKRTLEVWLWVAAMAFGVGPHCRRVLI